MSIIGYDPYTNRSTTVSPVDGDGSNPMPPRACVVKTVELSQEAIEQIADAVKEKIMAKMEPPKMGRWIPFGSLDLDGNQQYNCSLCHCLEVHTPAAKVSYCWNCGAKMEGNDAVN